MTAPAGTGQAPSSAPAAAGFDELIHAPVRLRICAALDPAREIEFGTLLTLLDISKSALSKHISALADAGYVAQRRAVRDTRQRVWLRLTGTGRSAYRGHVAALQEIVGHTQPR
jgi:DNA-binding MarR family transcriptional regulator